MFGTRRGERSIAIESPCLKGVWWQASNIEVASEAGTRRGSETTSAEERSLGRLKDLKLAWEIWLDGRQRRTNWLSRAGGRLHVALWLRTRGRQQNKTLQSMVQSCLSRASVGSCGVKRGSSFAFHRAASEAEPYRGQLL